MKAPVAAGSRFGPYEVIDLLGVGGMSEVYRARDPRIGRVVALKLLKPSTAARPDGQRRFEQEARATGQLNHPNIVTVFDVGIESGVPFLVCELLEGTSLRQRLDLATLTPARVAEIGAQVASGLAAAHEKGVVHRDLKPENIFITRDGRVKILDFGIAKLTQIDHGPRDAATTVQETQPGSIVGTAGYMSPEQVRGDVIDTRSDLFSCGVVLYELLTGRRPFEGRTSIETMSAILHQEAQPPSAVAPATWSPAFDRIVLHCLEKDVSARFQSARDLAFALESVATLAAAPLEERSRSRPNVWRRVPVWWLALVAAAGVGAASLTGGVKSVFVQQHRDEAPTFSRVTRLVADGGQPVLAPDRQWVAYLASALGRPDVYVKYLSGGQTVNLTANERQVSVAILPEIGTLDVSPDGTLIAFGGGPQGAVSSELSTYVISAPLGGAPRKLVDRGLAVRWSPDGRHITYMKPGGAAGDSLWVADANGEHARLILEQSVHAHWPAWSADGRFIYYNRAVNSGNREPVEVFRVPVEGGKPERVIATSRRAMYPSPSLDGRGLLYCSNPVGVEMALWWKPVDGDPIRVTTGIGEYAESRLSRDGRSIVATVGIQRRQSLISMAVSGNRSAVMPITSGESGDFDATVSPKGDRIALSSARSGDRNIWTVDLNGANGRPVTAGSAVDERPAWSPDGRRIAFVSSRGGRSSIWATDVDGGAPTHVADAQVLDTIAWSPDGTQLVYAMNVGASSALFLVPAEGGTPRRLHTPGRATAPTWSAAANMIAYIEHHPSTRSQPMSTLVAFVTPNGDIPRPPLSGGTELSYATIAWSPDGRAIAGAGSVGGVGVPPSVWLLPLEGPARRLVNPPGRPRGITWTADGKHVIVSLAAAPDEHPSSEVVLFEQGH